MQIPNTHYGKRRKTIRYIVIHYVGGPQPSARKVYESLCKTSVKKSCHFIVDANGWIQCLDPVKCVGFHCGCSADLQDDCLNANSIGIEMCDHKASTKTIKASDSDWYFDECTIQNTVELTAKLMIEFGVDISHVIRHYDANGVRKLCPRPFVGKDKSYSQPKYTCDEMWEMFLRAVDAKYEEMKK